MIEQDEHAAPTLTATVANHTTETATIPMAAIRYLDAQGEVLWVDAQPLSAAIRSQRASHIRIDLFDVESLEEVAVDGIAFDNGRSDVDGRSFESATALPVTGNSKVAAVAVTVSSFEREQG